MLGAEGLDQFSLSAEVTGVLAKCVNGVGHHWPNSVKRADFAAGIFAHVAVSLLRPVTQLADIPEHQNGAAGKAGEYINGGAHRGGVRVVSVIDNAHAVAGQLCNGAPLDRLHRAKAGGDAGQGYTQRMGSGCGSHGIGDVMGAEQVQLNTLHTVGTVQVERRTAASVAVQVTGVEVGRDIAQGKGQYFATGCAGLPDFKSLVIEIEHSDAVGIQPFDNLALGLDDFFRPAKLTHVGSPGVIEHGDMGLGHRNGVGNFAETRSTQFDYGSGMFRRQFEQGQGAPRSLFRLPRVASTGPRVRKMLASISLTVVLPLEPVMAATGWVNATRLIAPS